MRLAHLGFLAAGALALGGSLGCEEPMMMMMMEAKLNPKLLGTWKSAACELGIMSSATLPVSIYYQREYRFTETDWSATVSVFIDPLCATTALKTNVKGTYTVGNAATAPAGGTEIDFAFAERRIQLLQPQAALLLNTIMCGGMASWTAGPDVDVSTKGCKPLMPSNIECPKEFDVAKIDVLPTFVVTDPSTYPKLTLGARPMSADGLCKARPATFSTTPMAKTTP